MLRDAGGQRANEKNTGFQIFFINCYDRVRMHWRRIFLLCICCVVSSSAGSFGVSALVCKETSHFLRYQFACIFAYICVLFSGKPVGGGFRDVSDGRHEIFAGYPVFFTDVSDYGGRTAGIDRMASSGGQCYDGSILSYDADSGV